MIGHTFEAADAIEAIFRLVVPNPRCDLDYIPNDARPARVGVPLSHVVGLGGHYGCLVLGRR